MAVKMKTLFGLLTSVGVLGSLLFVSVDPDNRVAVLATALPLSAAAYLMGDWLRQRRESPGED
jgi:hypothetical protein